MLWAARCAFTSAVCPSLSSRLACDTDQGPVKVDVRVGMGVCVSRGAAQGSGSAGCRAMQRACECGSDSAVHVCQPRLGRHVRGGFSGVLAGSPRRAKHSDARCRSLHRRARARAVTHARTRAVPSRHSAARQHGAGYGQCVVARGQVGSAARRGFRYGSAGCRAMQRACECGSDSAVHVCQPRLDRHVRGGFSGVLAGSPRRAKHSDARCRSLHRRVRARAAMHARTRAVPSRHSAARQHGAGYGQCVVARERALQGGASDMDRPDAVRCSARASAAQTVPYTCVNLVWAAM